MDRSSDFDPPQTDAVRIQQRIGQRYDVTIPVQWSLPRAGRFRPKPTVESTTTTDWSLTGLGFTGPQRDDIHTPCPILLTVGPVTGQAMIVVIRPTDEPGVSRYGVEFNDPGLEDVARDLISIHLAKVPSARPKRSPRVDILRPELPDYSEWS